MSQVLPSVEELQLVAVELMSELLVVTDVRRVIVAVNHAAERTLGAQRRRILGRRIEEIFPADHDPDGAGVVTLLDRVAAGESPPQGEYYARTCDGEHVPIGLTATARRDDSGDVVAFVLVGTDLREVRRLRRKAAMAEKERARYAELGEAYEELQRMQERMIHAEKMASLDRLSAGVAHEINNPLGGILAYAHLLAETLPESDDSQSYLDIIIREATRCRDIVRGLLDFARVSRGQAAPVDVNEIVLDALAVVSGQSLFHDIETSARLGDGIPLVEADRNHLQQAFFNIIYNAGQAMRETGGGRLEIETSFSAARHRVRVSFRDNGPGIPADRLKVIFEPFYTTKDVGEGTGLGLAVVRGIVAQHDGAIEVESRDGRGARFTIWLPPA